MQAKNLPASKDESGESGAIHLATKPAATKQKVDETTENVIERRTRRLRKATLRYTPTEKSKAVVKLKGPKEGKDGKTFFPLSLNPGKIPDKKQLDPFVKFIKTGLVRGHTKM